MRVMILRLEGPLMAFGDVAIDEIRPTRRLPTRSMLTGLLGNALGFDHSEGEPLTRLQDRLRFVARLDREGRELADFQTAEIRKDDVMWTTRGVAATRAGGENSYSGPVLRDRRYRADSAVTVALALAPADEEPTLEMLVQAVVRPERPLFLGRKGCPPAAPLFGGLIKDAVGLLEALDRIPPRAREGRWERPDPDGRLVEIDAADHDGLDGQWLDLADRRDWTQGFHAGSSRRLAFRHAEGGRP